MDEGLGFALVPIFVIVLPIVISSFILYFIGIPHSSAVVGYNRLEEQQQSRSHEIPHSSAVGSFISC